MQENKVVLVTGSSRGISAGLVKNLAKKGCQVVINYAKSDEEARQLYNEISNHVGHGVVLMVKADVSRRGESTLLIIEKRSRVSTSLIESDQSYSIRGLLSILVEEQEYTMCLHEISTSE